MSVSLDWHWGAQRLPILLQAEASECGLASVAMVAMYHGHRTDLTQLRRHFAISRKGATLHSLMQIAEALQLQPRPLRIELHELAQLPTPCVLHWDLNHFVVLKRVTRRGAEIHDPAVGLRHIPWAELNGLFSGVALVLTPQPASTP
jgi:ATP-binding cassette, subfamily B, bacterial CvaB/MchF/RaxB